MASDFTARKKIKDNLIPEWPKEIRYTP